MTTAELGRARASAAPLSLLMATLALACAPALADTRSDTADARARHHQ